MGKSFYPSREAEIFDYATQMHSMVSGSPTTWGLTTSDVTALNTIMGQWDVDYGQALALEKSKLAAVSQKDARKAELIRRFRLLNNKVQATPSVTAAMKVEAGFSVPDTTPTAVIAQTVTTLSVTGFDTGANNLKWARSGNKSAVKFAVFVSYDNGAEWSQVTVVTKTKFEHKGQTPGQTAWYKVVAYSASNTALASPIAVVYADGGSESFELAA